MEQFVFTVTDPQGIHARPAGLLVKEAKKYPCMIRIAKDEKQADAKKMFALMGLGIQRGDVITVSAEGEQEEAAAEAMKAFPNDHL